MSSSMELDDEEEALDNTVPVVGMEFPSREDAYHFYRSYSSRLGFGIVRRSNHNFDGQPSDATFSYSKEKKPVLRCKGEGFKMRCNSYQGTYCPAKIIIKDYGLDGVWTVSFVENDHNHDLRPDAVRYMRYDMTFAPFVGVNHHGHSILLACALLADECIPTYEWLFNTFPDCMCRVPPPAIITDQCAAMCSDVSTVFPCAHHRLCLWRIMKKLPAKAGSGDNKDEFMSKVCDLVYYTSESDEFEQGWQELIQYEDLPSRQNWLERMYTIRSQWVPLYVKKYFWVGMSTTQRSESMNSFFDGYVNSSTSLRDFVDKYDLALQAKWEKEYFLTEQVRMLWIFWFLYLRVL